ncbi:MAG TPA: hypothetical protein VLR89_03850, partial [Anaerolineaceae bacterium]|nr:hypothetical protein [Anaerolineaceae bacterium]
MTFFGQVDENIHIYPGIYRQSADWWQAHQSCPTWDRVWGHEKIGKEYGRRAMIDLFWSIRRKHSQTFFVN